jgi:hypothetical protein
MSDFAFVFIHPNAVPLYIMIACLYIGITLVRDKQENGKVRPATTGEKVGGSFLIIVSILIAIFGLWLLFK